MVAVRVVGFAVHRPRQLQQRSCQYVGEALFANSKEKPQLMQLCFGMLKLKHVS